ncbi:MAG: enoyl-CoA hydratase-related protein [Solirubrobacteraceae bacterium]
MSAGTEAPKLETVNVHLSGDGTASVELNRPERMNAFNAQLGADLLAAFRFAGEQDSIRAVLLTGAGRAFSSGADLKGGGAGDLDEHGRPRVYEALMQRYHPVIEAIRELPKPVVAAVSGAAAGLGCSLALACDLVVAAESSYFLLAFVNIGLVPDGGSSLLLPSRVGMARAAEMAMLGERVPAGAALAWGLVNRVVADESLRGEALALAQRLAAGPTRSYAASKRELNSWLYSRMSEQLELEARLQQELVGTDDFSEGVAAFLEKREPRFRGR